MIDQHWFEMPEYRRRRAAESVWVPLRVSETVVRRGEPFRPGVIEETHLVGTIAFPPERRELAESLGWMELGLHDGGPYAYRDGSYKPCEIYQYNDGEDAGVDLVFRRHFNHDVPDVWHLSQDIILALDLLQEGDNWVRPVEDFVPVIRQRRDPNGGVVAIEIRNEFLRDYLAARGLALRVATYRQRSAIVGSAPNFSWPTEGLRIEEPHDRFEGRIMECDDHGAPYGGGVAVVHMWRTDVDEGADVPVMGLESDDNVDSASHSFTRAGPKFFRIDGEIWREEWIEPASRSERVRGDNPAEVFNYIVDASGEREPGPALNDEDIGRWLWFDPNVIVAASDRRGGGLEWYTRDTGQVWSTPGYSVHFGVNGVGLLTVYARDVARLPIWQQRIWAGHNVSPEGLVSDELLASQVRARPANTIAPEAVFTEALGELDEAVLSWTGERLFQKHDASVEIAKEVHRFRALNRAGLLALAKDVARLVVDTMQIGPLRTVAVPPKGEKWGSLKSLEKALATLVDASRAHSLLTPLVGIYELRLGDAHLPSSELKEAFAMVGLNPAADGPTQGALLITAAATAMAEISRTIRDATST